MTSTACIATHRSTSSQHNNGLLFQFILVQFIEAYTDIQSLETLCHRKPAPLVLEKNVKSTPKDFFNSQQVGAILTKLAGTPRQSIHHVSWNYHEGLLAKLKTNCALLLNQADANEKELIALQHYAEKTWAGCVAAVDSFRDLHKDKEKEHFIQHIDKTSQAMSRFAKLIARIPHIFRDNENVLFCILCYKESLDRLYGPRFVAKLLTKMHPGGFSQLQAFITKKYSERGFHHLIPAIISKITELEVSVL